MKVYEALAKAFVGEGTTAVFGIMGDANMYWIEALDELGVAVYETRHEGDALAMADGWQHNVDGQPGVCVTTCGPGTSQLATSMVVASRGRSPIVAFCGEAPVGDPDYIQAFDHARFAAAIECGYVFVNKPDAAYEAVQKAFYLARTESRPIMLGSPMDTQQAQFDDLDDYVPSAALLTGLPTAPNTQSLQRAADIVQKCKHPVVIVGIGAKQSHADKEVLQLASNIGAVIATSMVAKNWLGDDEFHVRISGLYATRTAIELFSEADCVIAIGASMNNYTTEHGYLFPEAKFIQIDTRPQVVFGEGRSADCYIQSDAALGAAGLNEVLEGRFFHQVGNRTPRVKERLLTAFDDPEKFELNEGELDPRDVCRILDETVPSEVGLVIGSGHATNFAIMLFNRTRKFVNMRKNFGCIGQALSNSIGASTAYGKSPVMMVDGDVGFMMHLGEFETACRYDVPILACILNDQAMGSEYQKAKAHGLKPELSVISTPNLGAVGIALGGNGHLIQSLDDLRTAAKEFTKTPRPTLLDIRISRNVLSIPYRRKEYGRGEI